MQSVQRRETPSPYQNRTIGSMRLKTITTVLGEAHFTKFQSCYKAFVNSGQVEVSRRAGWNEGNRWRGLSCKSKILWREVGSEKHLTLAEGVVSRGGDPRSG